MNLPPEEATAMLNRNSPLPEGWADDPDLLTCPMAAWESHGAREPLPACVGGETSPPDEFQAVEGDT